MKVNEKHAETLGDVDNRREEPRKVSEAEVPVKGKRKQNDKVVINPEKS